MKTYRVRIVSRYEDGTEEEIMHVDAYDTEHAEEKAFELCGGPSGHCSNVTFHATLLKSRRIPRA